MRSLDVLVVGGGAGALATAALLGKRGLRGLVVDHHELESVAANHRADWVWDDRHAPILAAVHEELGLQDVFRRQALAVRPGLRLIGARRRVELEPEDAASDVLARLVDLSPKEVLAQVRAIEGAAKKVADFFAKNPPLNPGGFFERRKLTGMVAEVPELSVPATEVVEPRLLAHLQGWLPFLTNQLPSDSSLAVGRLARPVHLLLQGPRLPERGRPLREVLWERAERSGFEIEQDRLTRLEPDGKRFRVTLGQGRGELLVDAVVDASQAMAGLESLPHEIKARKLTALLGMSHPAGYVVELSWIVDREVVPEPLGGAALLGGDDGDPPIWLSLRPDEDEARVRLVVERIATLDEQRNQEAKLQADTRARLERLMPFFVEGHPAAQVARWKPRLAAELDPHTGLAGLPTRTPLKNLVLAGPLVLPGCTALEGAYLAATRAAAAVTQNLA